MKPSGTAATARHDRAHRKAPPAKSDTQPTAVNQTKAAPAVAKPAARPMAARAAATAIATKSTPVEKKAAPAAAPAEETTPKATAPATKPTPSAQKLTVEQAGPPESPAASAAPATPANTDASAPEQSAPRAAVDAGRRPGAPGMHTGPITAPRIPAKAEVFHEGDHVVYPTHGVGKVERIATEEIAGHKLELIHITFEENRMTLRVPVAKARTAGLRKLATRKLFEEALNVLKGRARIKRTMWSRRAQEYEAKINSGDPLAIAEVVRDLHRNAGQPDQSFSERQIYEAAMERLAAELAALDKTDKATAATKLTDFLKTV